ncbi:MAG: ATP phosphoribosyltransferase regulatory subunit [Clostridia bacterium]|nr:ATP phosphoribosyltransferase regulatory subunit [Clostridia bacterium]
MEEKLLKNEERAILALRTLYRSHGYLPFKMSKFEEYELYVRNKDFLVSDRIITFNDTNGKLMALKPDVTLSIIKNTADCIGVKQRVYYNENVYRVSERTHQYKEIMQAGLECVGDVDAYDVFETVLLAAKSLALISDDFVLDVSHLGILTAVLDEIGGSEPFRREAASLIAGKNRHDLEKLCISEGIGERQIQKLLSFIDIYGEMDQVLARLAPICESDAAKEALGELGALAELLRTTPYASRIRFDFSIVNDMSYYNGIVFRGFLAGICEGVLAGGRYDKLLRRMGRKSGAIGFALYLDLLEELTDTHDGYDVDVLLLCDGTTAPAEVAKTVGELTEGGECVSVQRAIPEKLRYRRIVDLRKGEPV